MFARCRAILPSYISVGTKKLSGTAAAYLIRNLSLAIDISNEGHNVLFSQYTWQIVFLVQKTIRCSEIEAFKK